MCHEVVIAATKLVLLVFGERVKCWSTHWSGMTCRQGYARKHGLLSSRLCRFRATYIIPMRFPVPPSTAT